MPANSTMIVPENVRGLRKLLLELVGNRPVPPFRIHLADGRTFDVRYPNMLLVMNTYLLIGIPETNVPDPLVDYSVEVDITAVRGIEVLPSPEPSSN